METMTKKAQAEARRAEAIDKLRELLPAGTRVPLVLEHVTRSGMSRRIKVYAPCADGDLLHISHLVSVVTGWSRPGRMDGVKVDGCGMDMGFHLVYTLAHYLYGDGYALKARWL